MGPEDELACLCEGAFARETETRLRRELYAWRRLRADRVVLPVFEVAPAGGELDFALE